MDIYLIFLGTGFVFSTTNEENQYILTFDDFVVIQEQGDSAVSSKVKSEEHRCVKKFSICGWSHIVYRQYSASWIFVKVRS
jgi:hypothetical protein